MHATGKPIPFVNFMNALPLMDVKDVNVITDLSIAWWWLQFVRSRNHSTVAEVLSEDRKCNMRVTPKTCKESIVVPHSLDTAAHKIDCASQDLFGST